MCYEIILAPEAANDLKLLDAHLRAEIRDAKAALSEVKDDLSKFLRQAEKEEVVITRHGRPAGILIGFSSEEDWFDYRLEHDPRFLERIESTRRNIKSGRGIRIEDIETN